MVNKLLHPQEIETFYVIPTLRKYLALHMVEELNMKQKDVAGLLMINSATISQYRSNKRADQLHFNQDLQVEIRKSALLIKDKMSYLREVQRLLQVIRNSKALCDIHRQFSDVPLACEPQAIGCDLIPIRGQL